jgi:hypothetical protein
MSLFISRNSGGDDDDGTSHIKDHSNVASVAHVPAAPAPAGLRHFSLKVCRKVEAKGTTTYADVADELAAEFELKSESAGVEVSYRDLRNIRRRVFDSLNVLLAINIITKDKKAISWVGLPVIDRREAIARRIQAKRRLREELAAQVSWCQGVNGDGFEHQDELFVGV